MVSTLKHKQELYDKSSAADRDKALKDKKFAKKERIG